MSALLSTDVFEIGLLGGFRIAVGGRALPAAASRRRQSTALIQLLALAPGHLLHREQLIEALWPETDADAASSALRVALHRARQLLEDAGAPPGTLLTRAGNSVILGPAEAVRIDVDAFEVAVATAWRSDDPVASEAALALYGGDLLPEEPFSEWAESRRVGLRASYLTLLARVAALHERREEPGRAIAALERLVATEPTQEEAHAELMRLLALTGQRGRALAQFSRLTEILAREVNTSPDPTTLNLAAAIRTGHFPEQVVSLVPKSLADATSGEALDIQIVMGQMAAGLPAPPDALIGREREVAELQQLLSTGRLVTLTGPGGVGKTRLVLAVAQETADEFPDGVAFIDLSPMRDPSLVVPGIAHALGVRDAVGKSSLESLVGYLAPRRSLLVLDNLEQVLTAASDLAALLAACPALKILITSRARLRVRGEREYLVGPLPLAGRLDGQATHALADDATSPAATLFVERARATKPAFALTEKNSQDITAICARLDGLPLAIELAAAWVRMLPLPALLERLEERRLTLPSGARDLPDRQRTIRDTIAWSHELLQPEEQALFRRLGVFAGGWTVEAACTVTDPEGKLGLDVVDGIASLVEQSLVIEREPLDGEPRFAMLETIREFALERLAVSDEIDQLSAQHAAWFEAWAKRGEAEVHGAVESTWLQWCKDEWANLIAALTWLEQQGDANRLLYLATAVAYLGVPSGRLRDGRTWLERALKPGCGTSARANALYVAGLVAINQGDATQAATWAEEGLMLALEKGDRRSAGRLRWIEGNVALIQGDLDRALTAMSTAVELLDVAGDPAHQAIALSDLGFFLLQHGEIAEGTARSNEALALMHAVGDNGAPGLHHNNLAWLALLKDDVTTAATHFAHALVHFRAAGDPWWIADALLGVVAIGCRTSRFERAARLYGTGQRLDVASPSVLTAARVLRSFAATGQEIGDLNSMPTHGDDARLIFPVRSSLGEEVFAREVAIGRATPLAFAVKEAIDLLTELSDSVISS